MEYLQRIRNNKKCTYSQAELDVLSYIFWQTSFDSPLTSTDQIAEALCLSRRSVERAIKALAQHLRYQQEGQSKRWTVDDFSSLECLRQADGSPQFYKQWSVKKDHGPNRLYWRLRDLAHNVKGPELEMEIRCNRYPLQELAKFMSVDRKTIGRQLKILRSWKLIRWEQGQHITLLPTKDAKFRPWEGIDPPKRVKAKPKPEWITVDIPSDDPELIAFRARKKHAEEVLRAEFERRQHDVEIFVEKYFVSFSDHLTPEQYLEVLMEVPDNVHLDVWFTDQRFKRADDPAECLRTYSREKVKRLAS